MDEIRLFGIPRTGKFEGMTEDERHAIFDECLSTTTICVPTDILLPKYLFSLGDRVDPLLEDGKSRTTDGPYAETKEQLGGIQILEGETSIMPFS